MKLSKAKFKAMRENAYKMAGELGTLAELHDDVFMGHVYDQSCKMLDAIDELGVKLDYLNPETNEYE